VEWPVGLPTLTGMDVTDATFQAEVIERSRQVPVVVDLWAEWCGPCKSLGPILEKVIAATNGRVVLAKLDIDKNPSAAQAFQVQSIPAVFGMVDGKVAASFVGAQGEDAVRAFVEGLLPTEEVSEMDRLVALGDEASLIAALELENDNVAAVTALAFLLVERAGDGDRDAALDLLPRIPESSDTRRIAAMARTEPVDDVDASLTHLLGLVKDDEASRQRFLDLLELLGPEDSRTSVWRRRLTSALF
jgi:putative thioredoxin